MSLSDAGHDSEPGDAQTVSETTVANTVISKQTVDSYPYDPLLVDLNTPNYFQKIKNKFRKQFLNTSISANMEFGNLKISKFENLGILGI